MRIVVVLPEPFGPEEAVHRTIGHLEVDAIDGDLAPEPLGQPGGETGAESAGADFTC